MNSEIYIRKAHLDDLPEVFEMVCGLENKTLDFDNFREIYSKNLKDKNIFFLVANKDIETVGFISVHINALLHHSAHIAEIQELFIKQDFRNFNIGKKLIDEAEYQCQLKGIREIEVTSNKKNISAHRFYIKQEYSESHLKFTKHILPD